MFRKIFKTIAIHPPNKLGGLLATILISLKLYGRIYTQLRNKEVPKETTKHKAGYYLSVNGYSNLRILLPKIIDKLIVKKGKAYEVLYIMELIKNEKDRQ